MTKQPLKEGDVVVVTGKWTGKYARTPEEMVGTLYNIVKPREEGWVMFADGFIWMGKLYEVYLQQ